MGHKVGDPQPPFGDCGDDRAAIAAGVLVIEDVAPHIQIRAVADLLLSTVPFRTPLLSPTSQHGYTPAESRRKQCHPAKPAQHHPARVT